MKKALVIGGSSGIGLVISRELSESGYYVYILSRNAPEDGFLSRDKFQHVYCDLQYLDEKLIASFASDNDISVLMITAGFGRVADFEYFHIAEIRNMLTVNTVSTIQIIRIFYDRIKCDETFYCGVMGSISGLISSPMTSVYAASKAAVFRFIESVNIELEASGFNNRILNVSPGSFKGSRFYGGRNDPDQLVDLARSVLQHLYNSETLFIPKYEEIFKSVIERYHSDPHEYGLYSYTFKKSSERATNGKKVVIGYTSGNFTDLDINTVSFLKRSRKMCDYLIVGLYAGSDQDTSVADELRDRIEVIGSCRYVDDVITVVDDIDALRKVNPDVIFVNGLHMNSNLEETLTAGNIRKVIIDGIYTNN